MITKLLDRGERHAREMLLTRRDKSLAPFYHLVTPPSDPDVIVQVVWENSLQKDIQIALVKEKARAIKAVAAMFVGEAWAVTLSPQEARLDTWDPPSQSPKRVEIVSIVATDGEHTRQRMLQIVRDKPGGRIMSLIDAHAGGEMTGMTGRLIDGIIIPSGQSTASK